MIRSIPIPLYDSKDTWMWHYSKDGRFSVKSAYNLLSVEHMRETASSSNAGVLFDWNKVWNVDVPQKIKLFAWKCVRNGIASRDNLARKGVNIDVICPMCGEAAESTLHMLAQCDQVRLVWYTSPLRLVVAHYQGENFGEWCSSIWKTIKDFIWWSLFWNIAWGVWLRRNDWIFNRRRWEGADVIRKAVNIVGELEQAKEVNNINPPATQLETRWKPPIAGMIKVNADVALLTPNVVGLGGVMRDHVGDVVAATCCRMEGGFDVDIAEALAMRHALGISMEAGFLRLCLETDCLKLYSHLKKGEVPPTPFGRIVNDILYLSRLCYCVSFSFVKREGNQVAHGLAKACNLFSELRVWLEEYPSDVMEPVLADLSLIEA